MTVGQFAKRQLESNWTLSRSGRVIDVPEPTFTLEQNLQKLDTKRNDICQIIDGGSQDISPNSWGWSTEERTTRLDVNVIAADKRVQGDKVDGRVRVFGYRNTTDSTDQYGLDPGDAEDYGGLVGEVRAIFDAIRTGVEPWNFIRTSEVNDVSGTMPVNKYKASISIEFVEHARSL